MDLLQGETLIWSGHPTWRATIGWYVRSALLILLILGVWWLVTLITPLDGHSAAIWALIGMVMFGIAIAIDTLRRYTTRYTATTERLHIRRGIISRAEQSARMSRVQNINTFQGPLQRLLRVGVVDFDTAGAGEAEANFRFEGVADPHALATLLQPYLQGGPGL